MSSRFPRSAIAVDVVVLTIRDERLCCLSVRRGVEPYKGRWALPGGFVLPDEDLDEAAERELVEETGLANISAHLEQLRTYGEPRRDPRGRVVSVAYLALGPGLADPKAGSDAAEAKWTPVSELLGKRSKLAFDHARILADGVERARSKLEYTPLATAFCREPFTVAELRAVYQAVWGRPLDPRNFHRKVTGVADFLVPTGKTTQRGGGRPAMLYKRGRASLLMPPMLQPGT